MININLEIMNIDDYRFSIQIYDKGGVPYKHYTPQFLQKLFLESKTGANFELMSLIEGLSFLGFFIYCNVSKQLSLYDNIEKKSFRSIIRLLSKKRVISEDLKKQLSEYLDKRNEIVHNWLNIKHPTATRETMYDEKLGELFILGLKTLHLLNKEVVPSKENWKNYIDRISGKK